MRPVLLATLVVAGCGGDSHSPMDAEVLDATVSSDLSMETPPDATVELDAAATDATMPQDLTAEDAGELDAFITDAEVLDAPPPDATPDVLATPPTLSGFGLVNTLDDPSEPEGCTTPAAVPLADQDGRVIFTSTPVGANATYTCTLSGPTNVAPVTCDSGAASCNCLPGNTNGFAFRGLTSGTYQLTVRAATSPTTFVDYPFSFAVDEDAPVITYVPPDAQFPFGSPFFTGTAWELRYQTDVDVAASPAMQTCTLDSQVTTCSTPMAAPGGGLDFTLTIPSGTLEGPHTALVRAVDCVGNRNLGQNIFITADKLAPIEITPTSSQSAGSGKVRIDFDLGDVTNIQSIECIIFGGNVCDSPFVPPLPTTTANYVGSTTLTGPAGNYALTFRITDHWGKLLTFQRTVRIQ
jgi:hypothetical protein